MTIPGENTGDRVSVYSAFHFSSMASLFPISRAESREARLMASSAGSIALFPEVVHLRGRIPGRIKNLTECLSGAERFFCYFSASDGILYHGSR